MNTRKGTMVVSARPANDWVMAGGKVDEEVVQRCPQNH